MLRRDEPTKVDGMSYWGLDNPQNTDYCWTTSALLRYEDGRCGAWADFMLQMLKVQGIDAKGGRLTPNIKIIDENSYYYFKLLESLNSFFGTEVLNVDINYHYSKSGVKYLFGYFFVKIWGFSNNDSFYLWDREYFPFGTPLGPVNLINGNSLTKSEQDGEIAQNNKNPQSTFQDHAVVIFNDGFYDPSYGIPVPSGGLDQQNYEEIAIQGYGVAYNELKFFKVPYPLFNIMYLIEKEDPSIQLNLEIY